MRYCRLSPGPMHTIKTYIVEDSQLIRESLIATLEELAPVQVVGTADDETSAVAWLSLSANQCDLAVVDIFLKSGSGLGVLRSVKNVLPQRRLVVLSNYATPELRRKCLELGADRVFDKSNDIDALIRYCIRFAAGESDVSGPAALV